MSHAQKYNDDDYDNQFEKYFPEKPDFSNVKNRIRKIEKKNIARTPQRELDTYDFEDVFSSTRISPSDGEAEFDRTFYPARQEERSVIPEPRNRTNPRIAVAQMNSSPDDLVEEVDELREKTVNQGQEIVRLGRRLDVCKGEVTAESSLRRTTDEHVMYLTKRLSGVSDLLELKETEISQLNDRLRQVQVTASRHPRKHIDPEEVTSRATALVRKIEHDRAMYEKTSKVEGVEQRISEVRELFSLLLTQLNEFNVNNMSVTRTLEALKFLDESELMLRKVLSKYYG